MKIRNLKLKNYRNHLIKDWEFNSDLIIIYGSNGIGKTNILEAINVLSTGKSQKSRYDRDLINYDKPFCSLSSNILSEQGEYNLELQIIKNDHFENTSTKKARVNKVNKSVSYFCGIFNSIFFSPEDIRLLTGSPGDRRRYLDLMISQIDKTYKKSLTLYTKSLRHRNKILEKISEEGKGWDEIDFWTNEITLYGRIIQKKRQEAINEISIVFKEQMKYLNNHNTEVEIIYSQNQINSERLEKYKNTEIAAKTTLVGPHRDDFKINLNGHDISNFGSRGEQRSAILALKISEINLFNKWTGEKPVLLLDDIFSELDEKHKQAVLDVIKDQQTIITSAEKLDFISPESEIQPSSIQIIEMI